MLKDVEIILNDDGTMLVHVTIILDIIGLIPSQCVIAGSRATYAKLPLKSASMN